METLLQFTEIFKTEKGCLNYLEKKNGTAWFMYHRIRETHTNSIKSLWAIVKRGYVGIYHYWSPKHLQRFISEYTFRYNVRGNRFESSVENIKHRLTYKRLIKSA